MNKTFKSILALAIGAVAMTFASCSSDEDAVVPTQQEIESKIIGKWKTVVIDGQECPTNNRAVFTFSTDGTYTLSISRYLEEISQSVWFNCETFGYKVDGNVITKEQWDDTNMYTEVYNITDDYFVEHRLKVQTPTMEYALDHVDCQKKVTDDYTQDIIGMWEGVEMTGYETYGNIEARIEYKADGTYTYYKKVDGEWQPLADVIDEWNVDGDWLATRWQNKGSEVMNYEWWDIDYIKKEGDDIIMKWSALREKEGGERFTTTFTWKKVQ